MGRGSGSIRPHLAVLLLLTGVLAGLLLRTPVPSVPTPLPQGEVGERIAAALPAELSPCAGPLWRAGPPWWGGWATSGAASRTRWGGTRAGASRRWSPPRAAAPAGRACLSGWTAPASYPGAPSTPPETPPPLPPWATACGPSGPCAPRWTGPTPSPAIWPSIPTCPMWGSWPAGERTEGFWCSTAPTPWGAWCAPRRQGRGLYRPGPSLLV